MIFKSKILLLLSLALVLNGCNDKLPSDLAGLADQRSVERFQALPADSDLLLCLQADGVLGKLPHLGPDGRQVGRFGPSTLVVVSRDLVPKLTEVEGLKGIVLWGEGQAVRKLDPMLKSALLSEMAQPDWRLMEHRVIGTFEDGDQDLNEALVAAGARTRSAVSGIATFSATSEVIFDILAWDRLVQLKKPTLQYPTQSQK